MIRILDIIGLLIISCTPLVIFILPGQLDLPYVLIITVFVCGAYSFLFVNNLKTYLIRVVLAAALSCVLITIFIGSAYGYILVFYLVNCTRLIVGALVGFFIASIINKVLQLSNFIDRSKNLVILGLILFCSALIIWGASSDISKVHSLGNALSNRDELIGKIIKLVTKDNKSTFANRDIIERGYLDGLYSYNDENKITHEYAGNIEIDADGDELIITYKGIPAKKPCYWFYFMNSPEHFGFSRITVNGKSTKTDTNVYDMEQKKNDLCFSGKNKVEVSYRARIDKIKEIANW